MVGRVLIVDAEARAQAALATELRCMGYVVRLSSSPAEALEALRGDSFDVLVADLELATRRLELPVGDLIGLSNEISPQTRCVITCRETALAPATTQGLRQRGVAEVLAEPFGPGDLERALRKRRAPTGPAPMTLPPSSPSPPASFSELPHGANAHVVQAARPAASARPATSSLVSASAVLGADAHLPVIAEPASQEQGRASRWLLWGSALGAAAVGAALVLVLLLPRGQRQNEREVLPLTTPAPSAGAPRSPASGPLVEPLSPTKRPSTAARAADAAEATALDAGMTRGERSAPAAKRRVRKRRRARSRRATAPKTAAPKAAAPKTAAPKTAAPKTAAPKTAAPKTAAPKTPHKRPAIGILD
jgi:CheY-like chemotaxis protein